MRLDGSVASEMRMRMVDDFNSPSVSSTNQQVFSLSVHFQTSVRILLVSAKAGGTGLNLIGANRILLFEPDWNPATDLQVR